MKQECLGLQNTVYTVSPARKVDMAAEIMAYKGLGVCLGSDNTSIAAMRHHGAQGGSVRDMPDMLYNVCIGLVERIYEIHVCVYRSTYS